MASDEPTPAGRPGRSVAIRTPGLEVTGERLIPEAFAGSLVLAEHLARYRLAARLARGRDVLDAACGEGYGSAMLAAADAASVVGVDIDPGTVAHARGAYGLDAREGDVSHLPFDDATFDLVVSFETIEHVAEPERALDEYCRVLSPGGILVVSTPNADEYLEDNPYHQRELTMTQFMQALESRFPTVELRYQQTFLMSAVLREESLGSDDAQPLDAEFAKVAGVAPERALYGVAICSDTALPAVGGDVVIASDVHEAHSLAEQLRAWIERAHSAEHIQKEWEARATFAEEVRAGMQAQIAELTRSTEELTGKLDVVYGSRSWKVTRPLRAAAERMTDGPLDPARPGVAERIALTYRYAGGRELLKRAVTFPLRYTPLGDRVAPTPHAHTNPEQSNDPADVLRWYKQHGRPVTVVIPTYGDPALVAEAVQSVRRTTKRGRVRIIVADDASSAEHVQALRSGRGANRLILGQTNLGFAANANRGLAAVDRAHDVVLLNSDVVARNPDWLAFLQHEAYSAPDVGIVGARLLYPDGRIQHAGVHRNLGAPQWFDHRYRFMSAHHGPANVACDVLAVTGACMYVRREILDAIGLLDERYPMAYEDVDWCLRCWEAGYRVRYQPRAVFEHPESATRPTEAGERELASQDAFWTRWRGFFEERSTTTPDGRLRVIYATEDTGVGGGHRDIFEHLNRLAERGHDAQLYSLAGPPDWFDLAVPVRTFGDWGTLAVALAGEQAIKVATWWRTAAAVWRGSLVHGIPLYFVQDIETSYYPHSQALRDEVLASYREEFTYMTISGWNAAGLRELGREPTLIPPGIDLDTFRPLPDVERRPDMLLGLGRMNPLKNLPLTLDAWKALPVERPELCLFGVEPELGPLHGTRYVERPSDDDVNRLFNEATVFVQTSTHEGFCLPALEAMAAGTAVVCTDAHGNRDFCVDGENCLMPDPTVASVSGAITRLLTDTPLRERLAEAGRRTAAEYAWERRIDALEAFYCSLADGAALGAPHAPDQRSSAMRGASRLKTQ